MSDTAYIDTWLSAYQKAWTSNAPEDIAALFETEARYYTAPFRIPHVGPVAIVEWWIGQEQSSIPWTFDYEIIAREGDLYVVKGVTTYPEGFEAGDSPQIYDNIWLVTLDDSGKAREFIEYWMLRD
ncbi:MAG: nuclear transport factor 2 family protein [Actinobacteria bacterium]|nr:nuclear transport factor 2 family protein [Actinomycetota bacterium]